MNPVFGMDRFNSHLLFGGIPDGIKVPSQVTRVNYQGSMDGVKIDFAPVGLWDTEVTVVGVVAEHQTTVFSNSVFL